MGADPGRDLVESLGTIGFERDVTVSIAQGELDEAGASVGTCGDEGRRGQCAARERPGGGRPGPVADEVTDEDWLGGSGTNRLQIPSIYRLAGKVGLFTASYSADPSWEGGERASVSTILKALRRLEREKAVPEDGRSLREAVATGSGEPTPVVARPGWLFPLIFLLLGTGFGAGLLLAWPDDPVETAAAPPAAHPEPTAEAPRAAPVRPASPQVRLEPVRRAEAVPEVAEPEPRGESDPYASPVAVVARPERKPRIPPAPSPAEVPATVAPSAAEISEPEVSVPPPVVAQVPEPDPWLTEQPAPRTTPQTPPVLPPATSLPEPPPPAPRAEPSREAPETRASASEVEPAPPVDPAPAPAPPPVVEPPKPEAKPAPQPEPALAPELAPAPAPALQVVRTWWHPVAERREALLLVEGEEQRVREGQSFGDAVVTRIDLDGVLFTMGDRELVRKVGD